MQIESKTSKGTLKQCWLCLAQGQLMVPHGLVTRQLMHTKRERQLHAADNRDFSLLRWYVLQCTIILIINYRNANMRYFKEKQGMHTTWCTSTKTSSFEHVMKNVKRVCDMPAILAFLLELFSDVAATIKQVTHSTARPAVTLYFCYVWYSFSAGIDAWSCILVFQMYTS